MNTSNEKPGTVKITDDAVAACAMNAALHTEGVAELFKGFTESISNILGKDGIRGVKVTQADGGATIDIFPIVVFGAKIPEVAFHIQKNVKKEVEDMFDLPVKAVNIHVQGVDVR